MLQSIDYLKEIPEKKTEPLNDISVSPSIQENSSSHLVSHELALAASQRKEQTNMAIELAKNLRIEADAIAQQIQLAEMEFAKKEEEAFCKSRNEMEVSKLLERQQFELQEKRELHEKLIKERIERRNQKKMQKEQYREIKSQTERIHREVAAKNAYVSLKQTIKERRAGNDALILHVEAHHSRQQKQREAEQERHIANQRMLFEFEIRHLKEEEKEDKRKEFEFTVAQLKSINKKKGEQLRELQALELRQRHERIEKEDSFFEEAHMLQLSHSVAYQDALRSDQIQIHASKDKMLSLQESIKLLKLKAEHAAEIKKMKLTHKAQMKVLLNDHKTQSSVRAKRWQLNMLSSSEDNIIEEGEDDEVPEPLAMKDMKNRVDNSSRLSARSMSSSKMDELSVFDGAASDMDMAFDRGENDTQIKNLESQLQDLHHNHEELINKSRRQLNDLKAKQGQELSQLKVQHTEALILLDQYHEHDIKALRTSQKNEIDEIINVQMRETQMDANMRQAERKMVMEKQLLQSVLNTVLDGVIGITTEGIIQRFNPAAELMFGYKSEEVVNQNVSILMPQEHAIQHDQYISNYLSTGIKKVVGKTREVTAKKKDGTLFPISLSLSEVKEADFRVFTGIVRDLTRIKLEKEEKERLYKAKDDQVKSIIADLGTAKKKAKNLLKQILPAQIVDSLQAGETIPAENFDMCTIFYSDIVGYTTLSSQSSPVQIVHLLNDLYTMFDEIIEQYDVYKVETIGDSYMVASGLPKRNGDKHAYEIAKMSLHLLEGIKRFKVPHMPDYQLRIRIGLHSGMQHFVFGIKMPRYCLFGETVTFASKMESTSEPMSIQISEKTNQLLHSLGPFITEKRTDPKVKGGKNTLKIKVHIGI
ncbi:hypothetical protein ROZALSC1DRAFT_27730 [Rozella allomycis CSF55]|uniref:PAS domain-containing protein n=1 Tax=Rozella allomycis (strain CSF55) TaxID=988480 RepID=A0A075ASY4_ROZAC|nr:PAS domain-containing protein [Rozella allomycis CSF55]RKP20816.1 hypothetical protein ROZALSC1DRAFT_27730 [Rozella allomycis CSF55]|eukprot:EPZ33401.1 PAS domain-containing protein [Rozella allomycis CSF55]